MPTISPITKLAFNTKLNQLSILPIEVTGVTTGNFDVKVAGSYGVLLDVVKTIPLPRGAASPSFIIIILRGTVASENFHRDEQSLHRDGDMTVTVTSGGSTSTPATPVPSVMYTD